MKPNPPFPLQELQSGTVRIDGQDIQRMGLAALRSRVGSVPQVKNPPRKRRTA
jgi:ABC-type bacteriocin/lantibiotic exporter with double-glycine peptidase domain